MLMLLAIFLMILVICFWVLVVTLYNTFLIKIILHAKYSRAQSLLAKNELSSCICQAALKYSQILVPPSSIQELFFLNTQNLVKVSSCMYAGNKKLYSIILLFCLRVSYLCNYILGASSTFGSFILGQCNTCWQFSAL